MSNRLWVLFGLVMACGSASKPSASSAPGDATNSAATPAETAAAPTHVSPPFSAAELRAGIPAGTEMRFRVESAGAPPVIQHWVFTGTDAEGCTIAARVLAEDGTLIKDEGSGTSRWAELESHAHFPLATTTRTDSSVDVPAGHFDTWLFVVRPEDPEAPVRKYQFARELPGPPVWMEVTKGGSLVTRMVLLSRTQPRVGRPGSAEDPSEGAE